MVTDSVHERLSEELQFYYKYASNQENTARRIYKLHNLLSSLDVRALTIYFNIFQRVAELNKQDCQMSHTFQIFKIDILLDDFDL